MSSPLDGRVVLLTRSAERTVRLAQRLEALGARVSSRPALAFEPPRDPGAARGAVERLDEFDWIVFTSANGVRFFSEQLRIAGRDADTVRGSVAVVGPTTARAAAASGLPPKLVAEEANAEGLAASLGRCVVPRMRILVVRPETTRPVLAVALAEAGARLESVAFYRTVPAADVESMARDLERALYDAVVFASPSAVLAVCGHAGERAKRVLAAVRVVAIGEVTEAALTAAGRAADGRSADPSESAVAQAVVATLAG